MARLCLACNSPLSEASLGEYARCDTCGSYRYISEHTAEQDNLDYFNQSSIWEVRPDPLKGAMMQAWELVDRVGRLQDWLRLQAAARRAQGLSLRARAVLEVGFGNGIMLRHLLMRGVNAYGIDLSEEPVRRFKAAYPEYADRVRTGTKPGGTFTVIYAYALLEHLDEPDQLLGDASRALEQGGWIVLGVPITSPLASNIRPEADINFWKPCHRAVYSLEGVGWLLSRCGFRIDQIASLDRFSYRVMNALLDAGHDWIRRYRSPHAQVGTAPGRLAFARYLLRATRIRSASRWALVVAQRT